MAVDAGLKQTYVARIGEQIDMRRDKLTICRDHQQVASFEAQATAGLSPSDLAAVQAAGRVLAGFNLSVLQAEETQLLNEINALQNLRTAIRAL
jgi:hypothetical protein